MNRLARIFGHISCISSPELSHLHQAANAGSSMSIETKVGLDTSSCDLLILGAGWTSTFLIPLCEERKISYCATSRSGKENTIPFTFDPTSDDIHPYKALPNAKTILITFPIVDKGATTRLVRLYQKAQAEILAASQFSENQKAKSPHEVHNFIQLGTTGIWGDSIKDQFAWYDRNSPYETAKPRVFGEEELLALNDDTTPTTVLNLSGLWGDKRHMKNYVDRVAPTKEALRNKGSIHLIHGYDVSRAILAVHARFDRAAGERWLLTDLRIYDWWDLAALWGVDGPQPGWVRELMDETDKKGDPLVRALPRPVEKTGRALDGRAFWKQFELSPVKKLD